VTERVKGAWFAFVCRLPLPWVLALAHRPPHRQMDLRRLAQANAMASPRRSSSSTNHRLSTSTSSTQTTAPALPITPRARVSYPIARSPLEYPSISASLPFDWEAARGLRDPPYLPLGPKRRDGRNSDLGTPDGKRTSSRRAVRKKSLYER